MSLCRRVAWSVAALVLLAVIAVGFGFWRAGYRAYDIHTGSMEPTLVPGDLVVDRPAADGLHPGQIITFQHSAGPDLVTHRITSITDGVIHTKGDANRTADVWDIAPDMVHGSVVWRLPKMGYVAVYARQPLGLVSIFTVAAGLILLWQLFFPSPPAGGGPVPVAPGRRHRRTDDTVDSPAEPKPVTTSRHARIGRGALRPGPASLQSDPALVGRHGVAWTAPNPVIKDAARRQDRGTLSGPSPRSGVVGVQLADASARRARRRAPRTGRGRRRPSAQSEAS